MKWIESLHLIRWWSLYYYHYYCIYIYIVSCIFIFSRKREKKKHKTQTKFKRKKYIMSGLFVSRLPFASLRPSFFLSKNFLSFRVIFCSIFQLFSYQLIIRCSLLSPFLTLKSLIRQNSHPNHIFFFIFPHYKLI